MSASGDNWAQVYNLNYRLVERDRAPEELNTAPPADDDPWAKKVTQPWALFLGEEEGGLIIEGDLDALADRMDDIQRYVHHVRAQRR